MQPSCDSLKPLIGFLKIFSLQSNKDVNASKSQACAVCRSVLMAITLACLSIATLYWKILYFYSKINISIKLTDAAQMIYDLCQYIVDLWFIYTYGRDMSVEYLQQYERIDKILDMTYYGEVKKKLKRLIIFFGCFWISSSVCDFLAWFLNFGLLAPFVYSLAYVYLMIKMITTLDLISQVMNIEFRLRCIGDYIQGCCCVDETKGLGDDGTYRDNWFYMKNRGCESRHHTIRKVTTNANEEMKMLSRYYLLLIEQTAFINKMYGMRILLNSLSLLIDMIRFANIAVRLIIGSQIVTGAMEYFPAFSSLMRLFTCVTVVVSLVDHCEKAYRQRDRIFNIIDHYVIMKDPCNPVRTEMTQFRDLLQSRPVVFHMAHFFRFDYSLLVSIASVVVTYTIIILQSIN